MSLTEVLEELPAFTFEERLKQSTTLSKLPHGMTSSSEQERLLALSA